MKDKDGKDIVQGDIIEYFAGSRRHIKQEYLVEDTSQIDCFRAIGHDKRLQRTVLRLFELNKWSRVIGNIRDNPEMICKKEEDEEDYE